MDNEFDAPVAMAEPSVSAQLKQAREAAGLTIKDIAAKTRVPIRHLLNLENEDFAQLPTLTYVIGFVRNYAKALDMDADSLVAQLRRELGDELALSPNHTDPTMKAADPARIPPKAFMWSGIGILVALLLAYGAYKVFASDMLDNLATEETAPAAEVEMPGAAPTAAAAPAATGPVVLTASDDVWVRIYTDDGKVLYEKVMVKGDSFTIPADVENPLLNAGRLQYLTATVGGKTMPPLGPADISVSDLDISAAGLLARSTDATASPAPTPATEE